MEKEIEGKNSLTLIFSYRNLSATLYSKACPTVILITDDWRPKSELNEEWEGVPLQVKELRCVMPLATEHK